MKPNPQHPHLGQAIEQRLNELGMTKAEFGRRINTTRQNVALILKKPSLDTELLWRIGIALKKDFFAVLSFEHSGFSPEHSAVKMELNFSNRKLVLLLADEGEETGLPLQSEAEKMTNA